MLDVFATLEAVPSTELPVGDNFNNNLAAMQHPTWEPLRQKAKVLLRLLEPITEANIKYFEEQAKKPFQRSPHDVALFLEHALNGTLNRQDWDGFLRTRMPGSPKMDQIREQCLWLERSTTTGLNGGAEFTESARTQIEEILNKVKKGL
ncbi:MAG: hypothetical protein EXR27_07545 [Betaproteobacteria bacterium]|nr:hypothetical protein [Betaproteobacteria bacterium]